MAKKLAVLVPLALTAALLGPTPSLAATPPPIPVGPCFVPDHPQSVLTISSLATSASRVNVTSHSQRLTFTVHAQSVASGWPGAVAQDITSLYVRVKSPASRIKLLAPLSLSSGTATDGTFTGSATIARWSPSGTWAITNVSILTSGGEGRTYTPKSHWGAGWPNSFTVISTPDLRAPVVGSVTASPRSIDTRSKPKTVAFTVRVTDNVSGVSGVAVVAERANAPGLGGVVAEQALVRKSGTLTSATFKGKLTIGSWMGTGPGKHNWYVDVVVRDRAGNVHQYHARELRTKGNGYEFAVTSKTDRTKPVLTSLTIPRSVDARTGDRGLPVTVRSKDSGSGAVAALVSLTTPSGAGAGSYGEDAAERGRPTLTSHPTLAISQCGDPGVWKISVRLFDAAGNERDYSSAQLAAMHLPSTVTVQSVDVTGPVGFMPARLPHAHPLLVTMSEPALWPGTGTPDPPMAVHDLSLSSASVDGTWTCRNAASSVVGCADDGADVTTVTFAPSSPFIAGHRYHVYLGAPFDTTGNSGGAVIPDDHGDDPVFTAT